MKDLNYFTFQILFPFGRINILILYRWDSILIPLTCRRHIVFRPVNVKWPRSYKSVPITGCREKLLRFPKEPSTENYLILQPDMSAAQAQFSVCSWLKQLEDSMEFSPWFSYATIDDQNNILLNAGIRHEVSWAFWEKQFSGNPCQWIKDCILMYGKSDLYQHISVTPLLYPGTLVTTDSTVSNLVPAILSQCIDTVVVDVVVGHVSKQSCFGKR